MSRNFFVSSMPKKKFTHVKPYIFSNRRDKYNRFHVKFKEFAHCKIVHHNPGGKLTVVVIKNHSASIRTEETFAPESNPGELWCDAASVSKKHPGTLSLVFLLKITVNTCFLFQSGDFIAPQLKVGDKVLLPEYGGTKVELEDKEFHLFRETDLLAKLD